MRGQENYTGKIIGKWLVLYPINKKDYDGNPYWHCRCSCENQTEEDVSSYTLSKGNPGGCKNCKRLVCVENGKKNKKYNKYDLETYNYGVGYTGKGDEFYFSKEDFEIIQPHYWHLSNGYAYSNIANSTLKMHRLICGLTSKESDIQIDHINRQRNDNRRENLRIATPETNAINHSTRKDNSSGITGVQTLKNHQSKNWAVSINYRRKRIHLGYFENFKEAVIARLFAELKYFGLENAPQRHLFEEYGII